MYAHYYATTHRKVVVISNSPAPRFGTPCEEIVVSGKVEARRIAAERGARCWNF